MKKLPFALMALFASLLFFSSCEEDDDVPPEENEEEIITDVVLTFTPQTGNVVTATAEDPDGEGPQDLQVDGDIVLAPNTTYTMSITLENSIANESITEEVEEEAEEHMFFFAWTDGLFSDPAGDGNIGAGQRADAVNYEDPLDANGYPVGLETSWTTADTGNGTFRVILKHQPDIKSATSSSTDGESDVDLSWNISIQ
jgi:hypothetical protein